MILWVRTLVWAQLGGSFISFTWGHSCNFKYLASLLGPHGLRWLYIYNCQLILAVNCSSFVLLCRTLIPRELDLVFFFFFKDTLSHGSVPTWWEYEPQVFLRLRLCNLSNTTHSIFCCSKQIKMQIEI